MSDLFEQDDNQQDDGSNGMKALRDAYKKLSERAEKLEADARKRKVEDLLPAGVNRKVASLYQGEPEGFTQWYEANKDVFGSSTEQPPPTQAPQVEETDETEEVDPAWQQSMHRITEGESGTQDATAGAGDLAKLDALMKQYGNDVQGAMKAWGSTF